MGVVFGFRVCFHGNASERKIINQMIRKEAGAVQGLWLLGSVTRLRLEGLLGVVAVPSDPKGLAFEISFPINKQAVLCGIRFGAVTT